MSCTAVYCKYTKTLALYKCESEAVSRLSIGAIRQSEGKLERTADTCFVANEHFVGGAGIQMAT